MLKLNNGHGLAIVQRIQPMSQRKCNSIITLAYAIQLFEIIVIAVVVFHLIINCNKWNA